MTTKNDFVQYKLSKAEDSLKAAEILYNNSLPNEAISKLYYAMFNAVNALLTNINLVPKTHSGAKALFHKEFVLTGIVSLLYNRSKNIYC